MGIYKKAVLLKSNRQISKISICDTKTTKWVPNSKLIPFDIKLMNKSFKSKRDHDQEQVNKTNKVSYESCLEKMTENINNILNNDTIAFNDENEMIQFEYNKLDSMMDEMFDAVNDATNTNNNVKSKSVHTEPSVNAKVSDNNPSDTNNNANHNAMHTSVRRSRFP